MGDMVGRAPGRPVGRGALRDVLLAGCVLFAGFTGSWLAYREVVPPVLHPITFDHWFESDAPNVKVAMLDRWSTAHWRAGRHPFAPIVQYTPTFVLHRVLGLPEDVSVGLATALFGGLLAGCLFVLFRVAGLGRSDSVLLTVCAGASGAAVFWAGVPELYVLTALSLVPILALAGWSSRGGRVPLWAWIGAAALTLGFSINCWAVGLLGLLLFLPFRKAVLAGAASFVVVWVLWRAEKVLFPGLPSFIAMPEIGRAVLFTPLGGGVAARLFSYLFHSGAMPEPGHVLGTYLTVQRAIPGVGSVLYRIGLAAWVLLLGGAVWAMLRGKVRRLSLFAGLALLSQLVFYEAFGVETFLYSAESIPLFLAFIAPLALTRLRRFALVLAALFVVVGGANNVIRFRQSARDLADYYGKERAFVARVAALTDPALPLVYGGRSAEAELMTKPPPPPTGEPRSIWYLRLFPDLNAERKGWAVCCDYWSVEVIEAYRVRGAGYFASSYGHGLEQDSEMLDELDRRYERLERTRDWAIYALHPD